jgi:hypothetical protein
VGLTYSAGTPTKIASSSTGLLSDHADGSASPIAAAAVTGTLGRFFARTRHGVLDACARVASALARRHLSAQTRAHLRARAALARGRQTRYHRSHDSGHRPARS